MSTQHTPTPWQVDAEPGDTRIYAKDQEVVRLLDDSMDADEMAANAAFIVLAVNSHEALVEAAKAMVRDCKEAPECNSTSCLALRAAIAVVEGRTQ